MLPLLVVTAVLCALISLWVYGRWNFGTLEKLGIPVVEHHPLLGSVKDIYNEIAALKDIEWMKKYGSVFGVYEGRLPQVFVCDPELMRQICIGDMECFNSKREMDLGDPIMNEMLDWLPYEKWKVVRHMISPAFSSGRVKQMSTNMREATLDCVKDLKSNIKKSEKGILENVAVDETIHTMLTDLASRVFFSIRINDPTDKNNKFSQIVKQVISPPQSRNSELVVMWAHTFPFLRKFLDSSIFDPKPVHEFTQIFKKMMEERRRSGLKMNDAVDLCIEWYDKLDSPEYKAVNINEYTLFCAVFVYLAGAQDQLSTILSTVFYHIAKDPDLEKKVYEELDIAFKKHNGRMEHEHLHELIYLNACINESLRMYPAFYRTERVCTKDWKNDKFGLNISKGTVVVFPIWAINRNADYVKNPDVYDPTRWLPANKDKLSALSATFGHGSRYCPAKKFSTDAMPLIAAYLLKDLKFILRADSKLSFVPGGPIFAPHLPIHLDIAERSSNAAPSE